MTASSYCGRYLWLLFSSISFICNSSFAQPYEGLKELKGQRAQIYFSSGAEAKAGRIVIQLDQVMVFYEQHLKLTPTVALLILSPGDWKTHANPRAVYGIPHFINAQTLVVASENNDFWNRQIPSTEKIPTQYASLFANTYSNKKGGLTLEPFFDLLAIHELAHAYHNQGGLVMQRKWMAELFANLMLHTYIAEKEPSLLSALTTLPKVAVATTDQATLKYTSLQDLEVHYHEIPPRYPENYGWYQYRWHIAAGEIYDVGGIATLTKLWTALKNQKEVLNDEQLTRLLTSQVHLAVSNVFLKWDEK